MIDESGAEHSELDGGFEALIHEGGFPAWSVPVAVKKGRFSFSLPKAARTSFGEAYSANESGDVPVFLDEWESWMVPTPGEKPLVLRGRWPRACTLRVLAAESGEDLEAVQVVEGFWDPWSIRPGEGPSPTELLVADARSPFTVPLQGQPRRIPIWVGAPGRAWSRLELDREGGGEHPVLLEPEARLRVRLENLPPQAGQLRVDLHLSTEAPWLELFDIQSPDHLRPGGPGLILVETWTERPREPFELQGISAGAFRFGGTLAAELDGVELGKVPFRVAAGGLEQASMDLSAIGQSEVISILGEVRCSPGWRVDASVLELTALEPSLRDPIGLAHAGRLALPLKDMDRPGEDAEQRIFRCLVQAGLNEVTFLLAPSERAWMDGMLPAPSRIKLWTRREIDGGQALDCALPEASQVSLSLQESEGSVLDAPVAFLRVDRQVDDYHCELQPQAIAFADCRFVFPAGLARFRIEVPGYLPIDDLIDLPAGAHEQVFRVVRTAAVALAFLDGERRFTWPESPLLRRPPCKASVVDVGLESIAISSEGGGRSVSWLRLAGRLVVSVDRPGRYAVQVRAMEGFLPTKPFEVDLTTGGIVPVDVLLQRASREEQ